MCISEHSLPYQLWTHKYTEWIMKYTSLYTVWHIHTIQPIKPVSKFHDFLKAKAINLDEEDVIAFFGSFSFCGSDSSDFLFLVSDTGVWLSVSESLVTGNCKNTIHQNTWRWKFNTVALISATFFMTQNALLKIDFSPFPGQI